MIFGSWVHNSDDLVLDYFQNNRNVDLNDYVPSGTWDLVAVPASLVSYTSDASANKTKVQMVYKIKMRRKSLFYMVNIIIPTVLLSLLSVCVFFLPTDDGEKITLSLGAMFALVVFFLLIAKIMPPTSNSVPLISKYLLFTFVMNILSVLNTCLIINLYYKKVDMKHFLPKWVQLFALEVLPFVLFLKKKKLLTDEWEESPVASVSSCHELSPKSSLYNVEKLRSRRSLELKRQEAVDLNDESNRQSKKPMITLESIQPTANILNACKSISYIADIMKAKAELNRVEFYFSFCLN